MRHRPHHRSTSRRAAVLATASVAALLLALLAPARALAQDGESEAPAGEIIPKPGSGEAPDEAGDRGGALQLGLLGLVTLAIAGIAVYLVRRSRPAREERARRVAAARRAGERPEAGP